MHTRLAIAAALAAAVATPSLVVAQGKPDKPAFKAERCYGVAKAGKNDCASTGNNSCAGTSKVNADPRAWMYVPEGHCDRLVGGAAKPKA